MDRQLVSFPFTRFPWLSPAGATRG
jgi:hypothetical protein